jgi:hypothetical protein
MNSRACARVGGAIGIGVDQFQSVGGLEDLTLNLKVLFTIVLLAPAAIASYLHERPSGVAAMAFLGVRF